MKPFEHHLSRRNLLLFSSGLVGTGTLTAWLGTGALAQSFESPVSKTVQNSLVAADPSPGADSPLTPDQALAKLMEGNQRFVSRRRINPNQDTVRLDELQDGQAPFAAILSCSDSRIVPEIAFDQGIGDLFVVRVAGNVAGIEEIASEEYAVGVLKSSILVVLGHEKCGAVDAAIKGGELPGVIETFLFSIQPAVLSSEVEPGDRLTNAVKANVRLQVQTLNRSSVIASAVNAGKLKVVGAYYNLKTGEVSLLS